MVKCLGDTLGATNGLSARGTLDVVDSVRERVKLVLERTGWSQRELARRAELPSKSHVSLILTKLGENVRPETLRAIAKAANVSEAWLLTGSGSPDLQDGPHVEREPQPAYSESEAPYLFNTAGWDQVVRAAMDLEGADRVPTPFFEMAGYVNEVMTGPPTPDGILTVAKTVMRFRTVEQAEKLLEELRAKHGRPPLRRGAAAKPAKGRAQ